MEEIGNIFAEPSVSTARVSSYVETY
jgi:hypothetical protein